MSDIEIENQHAYGEQEDYEYDGDYDDMNDEYQDY